MANNYFRFKEFLIEQEKCAMKVCTDSCILGAFAADKIENGIIDPIFILDIGGGTGLLSLMLAQKSNCHIDAVEIDNQAFRQMDENFRASPWNERLNAIHADIKEWPFKRRYDLIVSNPPFFENELKGNHATKVLAMHDSGLLLSELVNLIRPMLNPGGHFCIMVPYFRKDYLIDLLDKYGLSVVEILDIRQTPAHTPFRSIILGNMLASKFPLDISELTIKEKDGYSEKFKILLKDYYLKNV